MTPETTLAPPTTVYYSSCNRAMHRFICAPNPSDHHSFFPTPKHTPIRSPVKRNRNQASAPYLLEEAAESQGWRRRSKRCGAEEDGAARMGGRYGREGEGRVRWVRGKVVAAAGEGGAEAGEWAMEAEDAGEGRSAEFQGRLG